MSEIALQPEGLPSRRRRAVLAALLALAAAIAALVAPSRSEAEVCADGKEYTFCKTTNSSGKYTLVVPRGDIIATFEPAFAPYKDCTWFVAVDFGDETSGSYTWNAEVGLTESHTFPAPGSYVVKVEAKKGTHNGTEEACPNLNLSAYVTYPVPPPPPEEPPKGEPPPDGNGGGSGNPTGDKPGSSGPGPVDPKSSNGQPGYWRHCGGNVLAHRLGCRRARNVVGAALVGRLRGGQQRRNRAQAAGFSCHLRPQGPRRLACRRGDRRILSPLKPS